MTINPDRPAQRLHLQFIVKLAARAADSTVNNEKLAKELSAPAAAGLAFAGAQDSVRRPDLVSRIIEPLCVLPMSQS